MKTDKKQNTAMQELIDWSQNDLEIYNEDTDEALRIFKAIKDKATELLEKEKEQIEEAFIDGKCEGMHSKSKSSEEYFNEKFNELIINK